MYNLNSKENESGQTFQATADVTVLDSPFLNVFFSLSDPSCSLKVFVQATLRGLAVNLWVSDVQTAGLTLAGNMSHCFFYD